MFLAISAPALLALPVVLSGCHSAFISAAVINHSGRSVRLVEVDYPSASFGIAQLADGATFKYRFKVLGNGGTAISWTDASEKDHNTPGPELTEGEEGQISVTIGKNTASWQADVHRN